MNSNKEPVVRTMMLEQMKGVAYAIDLFDALINDLEDKIETERMN